MTDSKTNQYVCNAIDPPRKKKKKSLSSILITYFKAFLHDYSRKLTLAHHRKPGHFLLSPLSTTIPIAVKNGRKLPTPNYFLSYSPPIRPVTVTHSSFRIYFFLVTVLAFANGNLSSLFVFCPALYFFLSTGTRLF